MSELEVKKLETNEEYSEMVQINEIEVKKASEDKKPERKSKTQTKNEPTQKNNPVESKLQKKETKKKISVKKKAVKKTSKAPENKNQQSRRPDIDPFHPGEKVDLSLSYLGMDAGILTFETLSYVEVNGEKAYKFRVTIKSSDLFSMFYSLDNSAETYLSFDKLIPFSHEVHINESKQVKEARSYFDWKTNKAHYWEKKITDDEGEKKRKLEWDLAPFSQNVISTLFYMRALDLKVGSVHSFNVADDGKIIDLTARVVKQETIKTKKGKFDTVIIEPTMKVDGAFQQTGKIQLWLTNDNRKLLVKLKSKIKIGSINGELVEIVKGTE